jgi:hypothetical protein
MALEHSARVVHVAARGYGAAVRTGLESARFSHAVMLDCDMSYPVGEIPALLETLDQGFDLVLGNRMGAGLEPGAMPWLHRHVGTPVLSALIRKLTGLPVYDSNSGLRALRLSLFARMGLRADGMELASEMLMAASELGVRYKEVPIRFVKDARGRRSHLRPVADGLRHLRLILKSRSRVTSGAEGDTELVERDFSLGAKSVRP